MKKLSALAILWAAVAGCVPGAGVAEPPSPAVMSANPPSASLAPEPTPDHGDPSLAAVSASHPSPEAAVVLATCRIGDWIRIDQVAGMAKLPGASDLPHYVAMTGREPLLAEPGPVWVIQIRGDVRMWGGASPAPGGETWTDPICFRTNTDSGYLGTGRITDPTTGRTTRPESPAVAPDRTLPPLAP